MFAARIAWSAAVLTTLSAVAARADDRATAQELFQEGKALMRAGKIADACSKFADAAELSSTPGVRLNLGDCYDRLGRTASAWLRYDEAETLAERLGDAAAANLARSRLAAIRPRLLFLAVVVPPQAITAGLEVARDGEKLPQGAWGTSVPVDPGEHEIDATAPGHVPWSTKAMVDGREQRLSVTVPTLSEIVPIAPATPAPIPSRPALSGAQGLEVESNAPSSGSGIFAGPGGSQRLVAMMTAGAGIVGIGLGSYFGATMLAHKSESQQHQAPGGRCLDLECQTASQQAVRAGNEATVAFIAGTALLAAGAVVWFTAPTKPKVGASVAMVPGGAPAGAMMSVAGLW